MLTRMDQHRGPKKNWNFVKPEILLNQYSEEVLLPASQIQAKILSENCVLGKHSYWPPLPLRKKG